jgi:hypothetical protein
LHKYHNILNVWDYFIIQIKLERFPLKTIYKLQVSSARPFKVLQIIEINTYVIKLSLFFDINSTFDMKELVIYKTQELIHDTPFDILFVLSSSLE